MSLCREYSTQNQHRCNAKEEMNLPFINYMPKGLVKPISVTRLIKVNDSIFLIFLYFFTEILIKISKYVQ